jgi:putative endonuclease
MVPRGKGARYTSVRRPVSLVFEVCFATRSDALKEEARIKRLTGTETELISAVRGVGAKCP